MRHTEWERDNVQRVNVPTLHGILNIDKPAGWTSHDVVGKVRRLLGQKSVGHAGTLDPLATGVLLVCVGQATRLAEYLMAGEKVYRATIQLGVETDTYDVDGAVVSTAPIPHLTREDLNAALAQFVGDIEQVPPAYSAIKQDGVPAYRRARRGESVVMAPRRTTIADISLLEWTAPHLIMDVACAPGTYIRSLAHDLGAALGCGAALAALRRMQSGRFRVEDAVTLPALEAALASGDVACHVHDMRTAVAGLTSVVVDNDDAARLMHGQPIACPAPPATPEGCALQADGSLLAILIHRGDDRWWPKKVFGAGAQDVAG